MTVLFEHTEQIELLFYAIFGMMIASIPFSMKLWIPIENSSENGWLKRSSIAGFFESYGFYLSFPLAAMVFWSLVHLSWGEHIGLIVVSAITISVVVYGFSNGHSKKQENKIILYGIVFIFLIFSLAINLSTSFFESGEDLRGVVHHWAAYMSAAKSLASGLSIYRDFPTQYGLGPSFLIALMSRGSGLVSGMYYVVGFLQFFYWVSITVIAYRLIENSGGRKYILWTFALLVTTFGCFYWFPIDTVYAVQTPSLGGTRYLPATLFVATLLSLDLSSQTFTKKKVWFMHAVWALCALWSIESIFHVSLIWWPYYLYIRLSANSDLKSGFQVIFKSMAELICVAAGLIVSFLVIYFLLYRELPEFSVFTAFASNVPGPILIDFTGRFIFVVSVFFIGTSTLFFMYRKHGNSKEFHYLFVTILLAYAAFSYYIGRSHEYNVRPLIPYLSLILLAMSPVFFPRFIRYFSIALLGFLICWVGLNRHNDGSHAHYKFDYHASSLGSQFQKQFDNKYKDLGPAVAYIRKNYNESALAIDPGASIISTAYQDDWNAYNNHYSYRYLPDEMQKMFIYRSKNKLMKTGWILIHKTTAPAQKDNILGLFTDAYDQSEELTFGSYKAYRFVPKHN